MGKRWWADQSASKLLHDGFQSRDPTLNVSIPLLEQRERELSKLFLKRQHLGFQGRKFLDQVSLLREEGGQ